MVDSGSFWDGSRKRNSYRSSDDNDYRMRPISGNDSELSRVFLYCVHSLCSCSLCSYSLFNTGICLSLSCWGTLMEHHGRIYMGISLWALFGSLIFSLLSWERVPGFCITSKLQVCYRSTNREQCKSSKPLYVTASFIHTFLWPLGFGFRVTDCD